jgi:hypothetical protein
VVGDGADQLICGVTIADTLGQGALVRAVGPTLTSFGATDALRDTRLTLRAANGTELHGNSGWETGGDAKNITALTRAVGAFPLAAGSANSALAVRLPASSYTIQMSSGRGEPGIGLAEFYTTDDNGRALNLSTRARVRGGDGVLVGGFVIRGLAYQRLLIRAIGPTLTNYGVSNPLPNPNLTLFRGPTADSGQRRLGLRRCGERNGGYAAGRVVRVARRQSRCLDADCATTRRLHGGGARSRQRRRHCAP